VDAWLLLRRAFRMGTRDATVGQAVSLLSHTCRHHILVGAYTFVVLTLILSDILPRQAVAFMLCYPTRLLISSHAITRGRVTGSLLQL
jgi:hypothetical protein